MIAIICVDTDNGMMFNNRRQSQDRKIRQDIADITAGCNLWMNEYSFGQFKEEKAQICVNENFIDCVAKGEFCFVENRNLKGKYIEGLILYRWNKKYPADFYLDLDFENWKLKETLEFEGYSHEKITREVYEINEREA